MTVDRESTLVTEHWKKDDAEMREQVTDVAKADLRSDIAEPVSVSPVNPRHWCEMQLLNLLLVVAGGRRRWT